MQALQNAKRGSIHHRVHTLSISVFSLDDLGTSLPRYYSYYPHLDAARDRHIFVPKYFPNENPSTYQHKGLKYFQDVRKEKCFLCFTID